MTIATRSADRVAVERPAPAAVRAPRRRFSLWAGCLIALGLLSAVLTVWGSWAGSRSEYYASIAVSMSKSWPNFFFGALDPAGTVTLDKIPGSYWVPALFVKAFGFSTFAVVLPNALAAVAATVIVAITARRLAGACAGWIAGAIVATTPILVAVSRSNQPESFFVLGLALTSWAALNALRLERGRWLMLAGVFIAVSFQAYMLEAWALWPALAVAYLCTRQPLRRRIAHVIVAGLVSAALSVVWIVIVWLIPAGSRPYIGSTLHDDPWEMVFGYNGLGRFGAATSDSSAYNSFTPPFSGGAGVLRLFNEQLAGQIGWLIPAAVLAVVILAVLRVRAAVWVFVGMWLATFLAMFSTVAGMHQFYTAALAVPMGIAVGVAFGEALRRRMLWPCIALLTVAAATAVVIAAVYGGYSLPVAAAQVVAAAVAVFGMAWSGRRSRRVWRVVVGVTTTIGMLLTPAVWSAVTIAHPSSTNPVAGGVSDLGGGFTGATRGFAAGRPGTDGFGQGTPPQGPAPQGAGRRGLRHRGPASTGFAPNGGRFGGALLAGGNGTAALTYATAHATGGRYILAVFGAQAAAPLITSSGGASILPIGGFSGNDPVPTLAAFTAMVGAGDVRYVQTSGRGGGFGGDTATASTQILTWVRSNCTSVMDPAVTDLYDCAGG
ncbi:ArnT family glycosyltransferase [Microbacterium terrisoli]|uniref:ArnT family glycosyltransferase n=1 Tax=Microbacterium terrisoli TaxID=3242192 RepID=UPI00280597B7|nr:glycosyltransferase family 39 protein [Microbacterium protaetiae]